MRQKAVGCIAFRYLAFKQIPRVKQPVFSFLYPHILSRKEQNRICKGREGYEKGQMWNYTLLLQKHS